MQAPQEADRSFFHKLEKRDTSRLVREATAEVTRKSENGDNLNRAEIQFLEILSEYLQDT